MAEQANAVTARSEAQKELQTSETRYRRLFEAARDGILILNAVTGRITDVNPFMVELLGYSREEFLGKELWEIGLFKEKAASQAAFRELQEKRYIRYEGLPLKTKRGVICEVEFVSNVYREGGKQVVQCNIRDITKRKLAEKAQRQSEERFQLLVEGVKDYAVFMLAPDGRATSWNAGVERVLGYSEADFLDNNIRASSRAKTSQPASRQEHCRKRRPRVRPITSGGRFAGTARAFGLPGPSRPFRTTRGNCRASPSSCATIPSAGWRRSGLRTRRPTTVSPGCPTGLISSNI